MVKSTIRTSCFLGLCVLLCAETIGGEPGKPGVEDEKSSGWVQDGFAETRFVISGTGGRNNPLRRQIDPPRSSDELFVRFRLRYESESIDTPPDGDGEFFVLWMDNVEGGAGSTHADNIPNIGLHVSADENRFMVRFQSSKQKFGSLLQGDRDYLVVGRLWKSTPGEQQTFDQLDLWVDPKADSEFSPQASTSTSKSLSEVRWIGFSTGAKTEFDDAIQVWDVGLYQSWNSVLGLSTEPEQLAPASPGSASSEMTRTVSFADDVFPILKQRCLDCHSGEDAESGVRLDIVDEVLNKTKPFNAAESHLVQLVVDGEMPPETERLPAAEIETLVAWIDEGLSWDAKLLPTPAPRTDHWAFQKIERKPIPSVVNQHWVRSPVDAFIASKQEAAGIKLGRPADDRTLARRMSLDLLGLTSGESTIDAIDVQEGAAIDKALSHPGYGIRWGRHWLDLARWAESNGHQHNRDRPHAWRYRDWVVQAFNRNKPFDDFVREQIAGDLIRPRRNDALVATGFLSSTRYSGNELDKNIQRNDILVDVTNVTASAFLGLTLQCAQCHSHKFDPLSIRDYYRFQAFFVNGQPHNVALASADHPVKAWVEERWRIFDDVHSRLVTIKRKQGNPEPIYIIPKSVVNGMKPAERKRFRQLDEQIASVDQAWAYYQPNDDSSDWIVTPHEMRWPLPREFSKLAARSGQILLRGDVDAKGPIVQPGWPLVFGNVPDEVPTRLTLADWLTDRNNPLTARVWANRVWQWHFGRGLVETSSDFGTQGAKPTHPDLLDYLAAELIDSGWDTAHLHRLILKSSTYRQSHRFDDENAAIDPDNQLWWRWEPRRLEAEAIRDSILQVSDRLDRTQSASHGGPQQRSLFLHQKRDQLPSQQSLFDGADGIQSCSRRRVSTNALQPLWLMNDDFVQQAADDFARRAGDVESAFIRALGRSPNAEELAVLTELAVKHGLSSACLAILNSSEFLYIP